MPGKFPAFFRLLSYFLVSTCSSGSLLICGSGGRTRGGRGGGGGSTLLAATRNFSASVSTCSRRSDGSTMEFARYRHRAGCDHHGRRRHRVRPRAPQRAPARGWRSSSTATILPCCSLLVACGISCTARCGVGTCGTSGWFAGSEEASASAITGAALAGNRQLGAIVAGSSNGLRHTFGIISLPLVTFRAIAAAPATTTAATAAFTGFGVRSPSARGGLARQCLRPVRVTGFGRWACSVRSGRGGVAVAVGRRGAVAAPARRAAVSARAAHAAGVVRPGDRAAG